MPGERAVHRNAQSALKAILHPLFLFPWEEGGQRFRHRYSRINEL